MPNFKVQNGRRSKQNKRKKRKQPNKSGRGKNKNDNNIQSNKANPHKPGKKQNENGDNVQSNEVNQSQSNYSDNDDPQEMQQQQEPNNKQEPHNSAPSARTKNKNDINSQSNEVDQSQLNYNDNDDIKSQETKEQDDNDYNKANCFASEPFFVALYGGKQPNKDDTILTEYRALLHPRPTFNDKLVSINDDLPHQVRYMKLFNYIAQILFQFYAYQQYKHNYDYSGMLVMEARDYDTLQDLVPNCKQGERMDLCENKMISILYLTNEKMIKPYLKAIGIEEKDYGKYLDPVNDVKNDSKNEMTGQSFPCLINFKCEGWQFLSTLNAPNSCDDIQTEALLLEKNINQSGLQNCQMLNIRLKEQKVFALNCTSKLGISLAN